MVTSQVEDAFPHLFGGSADSPWESHRYSSNNGADLGETLGEDGDPELQAEDLDTNLVTAGSVDRPPRCYNSNIKYQIYDYHHLGGWTPSF